MAANLLEKLDLKDQDLDDFKENETVTGHIYKHFGRQKSGSRKRSALKRAMKNRNAQFDSVISS